MAADTKIITTTEIKNLALSKRDSFDEALIDNFILPAQRQYLRPFLSEDYYNEILTQVENSTLTADNSVLLNDYLKPMMAYFIVYDSWWDIMLKVTSKGIMKNTSETSIAASGQESSQARDSKRSMAERWQADAKQYIDDQIDDDSTKFPDFDDSKDDSDYKGLIIY